MPGVPQVAVFDTAFHQTMPAKHILYGLQSNITENYKVRRYGYGTSHSFVSKRAVVEFTLVLTKTTQSYRLPRAWKRGSSIVL